MIRTLLVLLAVTLIVGACGGNGDEAAAPDAERGEVVFANNCAVCHGPAGEGSPQGPPLVHEIYEPGHHPDESFRQAVAQGVAQHHWDFGPMPAIPGLSDQDVDDLIAYVRDLQREAGIIE